jgi:four helix bundle protein
MSDDEPYQFEEEPRGISEPSKDLIVRHSQLEVYRLSFQAANEVFVLTKSFPAEERFSLTDQVRKSSRSVSANIAEGWRKRRYKAAFQSALNIAEAEAAETQTWLAFALASGYVSKGTADRLATVYDTIIGKLVVMINNPGPWLLSGGNSK